MPILPYVLRTTYWIRDFLKGSPVWNHYKDIRQIMSDYEEGENTRKKYLTQLLQHAMQNSPFYSKYGKSDLSSFPVMNKSVLLKNYEDIKISDEKIPFQKGGIHIQTTSGSTGMPFAIPQNTTKRNRRIAELKFFGEQSGFRSHEKLIQLRTWNRWQRKPRKQAFKENIIPFDISQLNDERLGRLCDVINKERVVAIRGYASSLDLFTRYAVAHQIKFKSLRLMISGSEALLESTRDRAERILGCRIISQYANEENGILAQEYLQKERISGFFLNHASYFFEVLKMDADQPATVGEPGRIVITDLFNYAFPVIRYDTGDTGTLLPANQSHNRYPAIQKLYGRRLDLVSNTRGGIVHPIAFSRILKHYSEIWQWQFIQTGQKSYVLKLLLNTNKFSDNSIKNRFLLLFGKDAKIEIEFVNELPILASGKRKPVVNNWKNGK